MVATYNFGSVYTDRKKCANKIVLGKRSDHIRDSTPQFEN